MNTPSPGASSVEEGVLLSPTIPSPSFVHAAWVYARNNEVLICCARPCYWALPEQSYQKPSRGKAI